jgi:hypothetical protein
MGLIASKKLSFGTFRPRWTTHKNIPGLGYDINISVFSVIVDTGPD